MSYKVLTISVKNYVFLADKIEKLLNHHEVKGFGLKHINTFSDAYGFRSVIVLERR